MWRSKKEQTLQVGAFSSIRFKRHSYMLHFGFSPVFQVLDGFLIKIYQAQEGIPDSMDDELNSSLSAVYLVEPCCISTAVQKFSGTLGVSNQPDKLSATIMAFSHFVIQETACEYMFSDLQGNGLVLISCVVLSLTLLLLWPSIHQALWIIIETLHKVMVTPLTLSSLCLIP